ncbi:hypothetical protein NUU61_005202 [Penicillium alfredii]|uniref:Lysine-specific metallo-endopeptidase domain-containing protein n=1 Tax=Penicillium alfredii TaxID=1506179 RepID=A0A9W9F944_9EURO|nr:uncharacterized protein NUU61_005202 [Penicillium alfredii]KAJ5095846.1 hypothetical protein NUU61_005202 [Penicillium alfredii]
MRILTALLAVTAALIPLREGVLARKPWNQLQAADIVQWPGDCKPSECVDYEMDEMIQETALLADAASKVIDIFLGKKSNKVVPKSSANKRFLEASKAMWNDDFADAPDDPKSWAVEQSKRFILSAVQARTTQGWYISNWYSPKRKDPKYPNDRTKDKRIESRVVRLLTNEKICQGTTLGETFYYERVIGICNRVFSFEKLTRLIRYQERLAVGMDLSRTQKTRGGYFLHEALHFLDHENKEIDIGHGKERAYGWELCTALARKDDRAKDARYNPDNYHWFAMAVALHRVKWYPDGKKVL